MRTPLRTTIAIGVALLLFAATPAGATRTEGSRPAGPELVPHVVGGEDHPNPGFVVALLAAAVSDPFQAQFCGGSLIAPSVVLTAAHCVDDLTPPDLRVAVGVTDLRAVQPSDRRAVAEIVVHPDWLTTQPPGSGLPDLALLRLATPVAYPIIVGLEDDITQPDSSRLLIVAGWGGLDPEPRFFPTVLQAAVVDSLTDTTTDKGLARAICGTENAANDFCYGGETTAGCVGDSGGPLYGYDPSGAVELAGVVSYGPDRCLHPTQYDGGQRVVPHVGWITGIVDMWVPPPGPPFDPGGPGVACPNPSLGFSDIAASFARVDIACLYGLDITKGATATTFDPLGQVTREQMAAFLARTAEALGATCPAPALPFSDIAASFAKASIACLYGLDITKGATASTFDPAGTVTREQMAAFLARTIRAVGGRCPAEPIRFIDVAQSFARTDITCLHGLAIANGATPAFYEPGLDVTREQMAAFLARTVRAL